MKRTPIESIRLSCCLWLALVAVAGVSLAAQSTAQRGKSADSAEGATKVMLHREGTKIKDEPGRFALVGNRINFVTAAGLQYVCLENLNLERVARIMGSTPDSVAWVISGSVTEYQGSNYLLIERSTRKLVAPQGRRGY
ncbi:MAG TPA: hypothetical protein VFW87_07585 [Pirellulales bacterium]|nr:hypothetical protein [Pirellulales bacterium]